MDSLRNIYDPFFIVKCNGRAIPDYLNERITRLEFNEDYKKGNIFTIVIDNSDLALIDDESLGIGSIISCKFGYINRYTDFIDAEVKDTEGFTEIRLTAYSLAKSYNVSVGNQTSSSPEMIAVNKTYTVKSGDTLNKISQSFGLKDWSNLYEINKKTIGNNPNKIEPGMELSIPDFKASDSPQSKTTTVENILGVKTRVWSNMTYSGIANKIAIEMGLVPNITTTKQSYDSTPQSNETNFEFLKRIGKTIGFYVKMSNKLLTFAKKDFAAQSNYSLTYYTDGAGELIKFDPKIKTKKSTSSASSTNLNIEDKEEEESSTFQTKSTKLGGYSYQVNGITGEEKRVITPNKNLSNNKISGISDDEYKPENVAMEDDEDGSTTADCDCVGIPEIKAGSIVTVNGVGKKWGGNWYVKNANHTIDNSGFSTKLELSRNALGAAAPPVEGSKNESKASSNSKAKSGNYIKVDGITGKETKVKK